MSKELILVVDLQCFPCIDYFKILLIRKNVLFESSDYFQKMSFRNRYVILGANNLISLTIPIVGGREQKILFKDTLIDYSTDWPTKHWRAILSSYSKSPYFEHYADVLKQHLFSREINLFKFNVSVLHWILKEMRVSTAVNFTEKYLNECKEFTDMRNQLLPRNFQQNVANYKPKYVQVFEDKFDFQPNLSVLDLLFATGPSAGKLIVESVK